MNERHVMTATKVVKCGVGLRAKSLELPDIPAASIRLAWLSDSTTGQTHL